MLMKSNGINHPQMTASNNELLADVLQQSPLVSPIKKTMQTLTPTVVEDMDDNSPINGDPMISISPMTSSPTANGCEDQVDMHLQML